ncbi:alpha-2-macroglobulin family protein [Chitinophaga sp. LS1]|uniref:alpha-2-macroglobulin family protein n=1 Tax=Chitinophaga sp. LS1 TaxID=3051176 RepID=UPI002AABE10D|nr:alpha-2-macroglobulin family protein [Chitinophaga sp. LS1]WPV69129.1 alpha-2-macroglobulin family protein [Chitinophaga sp. LS1]
MAQFNYDNHWKKVQELDDKGLPKSALEEVNVIYRNALQQKNEGQLLKTLIFRIKYVNVKNENPATDDNFKVVDEQNVVFTPAIRAILQSMRAELLHNYLENNRSKLYSRTAIESDTSSDISTWTSDRLNKEIAAAYLSSLKDVELLKKVNVKDFAVIIEKGQNSENLRPTLYDLLAHRALDYFKSGEYNFRQAAKQFELLDPAAFAPAATFAAHTFTSADTTSYQYKALLLLQDLIRFHANDKAALLDVDIERIAYIKDVAVMPDKEELYVQQIKAMQQTYAGEKGVTQVMYLVALYYQGVGNGKENVGELTPSAAMKQAVALCEQAIKQVPVSVGANNCRGLLQSIQEKSIEVTTEQVNLPDEPFRALIGYKNVNKLYFRLVKIDESFRTKLKAQLESNEAYEERNKKYWNQILGKKADRTWDVALPGTDDYRQHTAEAKIEALPLGLYMLVGSINSAFTKEQNLIALQFIHVSNLSYIARSTYAAGDGKELFALHRKTGAPLQGVKFNVYEQQNNGKLKVTQSAISAKDGSVTLKPEKQYSTNRYELILNADTLAPDDYNYIYRYDYSNNNTNTPDHQTFLFTDRGIYRPGQLVYFKGIVVSLKGGVDVDTDRKILGNYKVTVRLVDRNSQKVDSMELTTNEYGAYAGKFRLPENQLNGVFRIDEDNNGGSVSFSVEEYKRPKFYVEFDTLRGTYRLNDTITVKGNALAYAGNNIDGAKVTYRVMRQARFPYWWMSRKAPAYSPARQIATGTTETAADGSFKVSFPALPDLSIAASQKPVFTYSIEADITDVNGETRTGNQSVSVGYQAMEISIGLTDRVLPQDLQKVNILTENLNGVFEPADVAITLKPLQHPGRLLRSRYWEKPDQFILSREEYEKAFPHDIYNEEDEQDTWKRGNAVFNKQLKTEANTTVLLDAKLLAPGWYELEVSTTDKFGEKVMQKKTFELVDAKATRVSYPVYSWSYTDDKTVKPGETAHFLLGSSASDLHIIETISTNLQSSLSSDFSFNNSVTDRKYDVKEADRGNVNVQYAFVKDNRVFTEERTIVVPWSNKELDVTIQSHRDKILPGAKEEWRIQIKGEKRDKIGAELLAAMYDASLDAFRANQWRLPDLYPSASRLANWDGHTNFKQVNAETYNFVENDTHYDDVNVSYDDLNWFSAQQFGVTVIDFGEGIGVQAVKLTGYGQPRYYNYMSRDAAPGGKAREMKKGVAAPAPSVAFAAPMMEADKVSSSNGLFALQGIAPGVVTAQTAATAEPAKSVETVTPRTNFNETAFFFPDLRTDENGNITFSFTVPEALTRWRFMSLAHTKDAAFGYAESSVITQKPLMVQPNAPRFMREGDKIIFSAKISNLADSALTGEARLELLDATTMKPVDGWFQNVYPAQHFTVSKGQSTAVTFPLEIPYKFGSSLLYRVVATAGKFSDGEENAVPVLTNSMLVTETLPLTMRGDGKKEFTFEKLLKSDASETLQQHALTVEYTGNPTWYAVQALPYLMEFPYECSEQVFNRYYANTLATYIVNKLPGVKSMFEKWKTTDTTALQSNLQKNEELKSVLLQETPWVLAAKNEAEQKRNIALLFDLNRMSAEQQKALEQLRQKQLPNGAFPWFNGMWEDQFVTQYILAGVGRLQQVGAVNSPDADAIVTKGLAYVDKKMDDWYHELKRNKADLSKQHIGYIESHYLYMRSLLNKPVEDKYKESYQFYLAQAKKFWLQQSTYTQAMLAIVLNDKGIIQSLKENATNNAEMGMYWKSVTAGYWWYQAPIETQAMLIEAFQRVSHDSVAVGDMKTWLLKNKQTNNWHTTKATADACYAMLLGGGNWLTANPEITIQLGKTTVKEEKKEAGTGYFKKQFNNEEVKPAMGKIEVKVDGSNGQPSWGAVYWQYFEQLDKITTAATPMTLQKQLFIEKTNDNGPVLTAIEDGNQLKVGDKVKARIVMKVDRDMEYVHLKDMRAACFEPTNVISQSGWQNGVSYYQSTKDASTNFFFSRLPKGTYVFEYSMFVTHNGDFSNGISTAQCMYAPEFSAHSEGIRVKVIE